MIRVGCVFIAVLLLNVQYVCAKNSRFDYPETDFEREMREMRSVFSNKSFSDNKKSYQSAKVKTRKFKRNNHYLFKGALEVLKFAPIASTDSMGGVVITDWYSTQDQDELEYKVMVYIKGKEISASSFEVVAFERKRVDNGGSKSRPSTAIARVLEEKIIKKAEELRLQSAE